LSQVRPSKAALFEFFAAFSNQGDGIDGGTPYPPPDVGQLSQRGVPIEIDRGQVGSKQLVGKLVRLHAATIRLLLKPVVGVWGDVDYPVARCHERKFRGEPDSQCKHSGPLRTASKPPGAISEGGE